MTDHDWWANGMSLPHNSDKWITTTRAMQRGCRNRRHDGHHRGHHYRTPCQRVLRYNRFWYPLKCHESWVEYCEETRILRMAETRIPHPGDETRSTPP